MKKVDKYDIIDLEVRWDIMNNNLLISTAMLSAYWEKEKSDILDLLMPFLKYSIGKTTKVGDTIEISGMISHFKKEFGYETMPMHVFTVLLNRMSPEILEKKREGYALKKTLDEDVIKFEKGHALFEEHRSKVVGALLEYLNSQHQLNRKYTQDATMAALISFFATNGLCIIKDTALLEMLKKRDDHQKYYIAQFIIEEYNKKSEVFSYIEDMVKGFFVSTAISIQPQNMDVVQAKFQGLNCYIDTRMVINALGLHLPEEKTSSLELLTMLKEKGAELYCFEHNVQEIISIITAYKHGLNNPYCNHSPQTLEAWDNQQYTVSEVDRYLSLLRTKISHLGITIIERPSVIEVDSYPFNDTDLKQCINDNMKYTKQEAVQIDIQSVASILLLRNGYKNTEIEKSKYVFITSNVHLTNVVNNFLSKNGICDFHNETMPIITDVDLSSIVWLKCYSTHKDFPKQKLIEQSLIALEPTPTMMTTFFEMIDRLSFEGGITADEAAILRADSYCKKELSGLIKGDIDSITAETVYTIREKVKSKYVGDANKAGELNYQKFIEQKNENKKIITNALEEIESTGKSVFASTQRLLKIVVVAVFATACVGLFVLTLLSWGSVSVCIPAGILSLISFAGTIDSLYAKRGLVNRCINCIASYYADKAKDHKKDEYEKILGSLTRYTDIET